MLNPIPRLISFTGSTGAGRHVATVAAAGARSRGEDGHSSLSGEIVLPFVGVLVPVQFPNAAGMNGDDCGGDGFGDSEFAGVHDTDFTALGALGWRKMHGAERKIVRREAARASSSFLVGLERPGNFGLEDEEFLFREFGE